VVECPTASAASQKGEVEIVVVAALYFENVVAVAMEVGLWEEHWVMAEEGMWDEAELLVAGALPCESSMAVDAKV
jgi:hypothetical protein